MPLSERTNEQWGMALTTPGPESDLAHAELRSFLLKGLARALAQRPLAQLSLEDFVQQAMTEILRHSTSFRGESKFTTWAMAIAIRVAFNELRHAKWKDVSLTEITRDSVNESGSTVSKDADPEKQAAREQIFRLLQEVIETRLTERQTEVVRAELRSMPQEELARRMGINRNALYKLGHDARKRLRQALDESGVSAEEVRWALNA